MTSSNSNKNDNNNNINNNAIIITIITKYCTPETNTSETILDVQWRVPTEFQFSGGRPGPQEAADGYV